MFQPHKNYPKSILQMIICEHASVSTKISTAWQTEKKKKNKERLASFQDFRIWNIKISALRLRSSSDELSNDCFNQLVQAELVWYCE